jgi:uncharacterized protein with FMN-binding domain
MKKRTKILTAIGIILALCTVAGMLIFNNINNNLAALVTMNIPSIDLSDTEGGNYVGSYSEFPVSAKVEVTIEDHQIVTIGLIEHVTGQGQAAESIPDAVVASQSMQVDTVSGATYSSVVILKAIEDALIKAGAKPI